MYGNQKKEMRFLCQGEARVPKTMRRLKNVANVIFLVFFYFVVCFIVVVFSERGDPEVQIH